MAENKEVMNEEKVYTPNRKREIIKTILIIFLAALLVLTFFSNTIMNRSLAEISTERTASGKLTERIRGNGTVESNQAYEVKVDGNKTIDTIMIKTGQEVKKDDVLFTVGGGDSEEIKTAEKQLSELELAYQKASLHSLPITPRRIRQSPMPVRNSTQLSQSVTAIHPIRAAIILLRIHTTQTSRSSTTTPSFRPSSRTLYRL